jgi:predicted nucleic acid-binding protein
VGATGATGATGAAPAVFFDTNILLYLLADEANAAKADVAEALAARGGCVSVQVLNEFTQVARRKFRMPANDVKHVLTALRRMLAVEALTVATHDLGVEMSVKYSLGVYDSMIVASALLCGATTLYSEDMHAGLLIEKRLRIVNPFVQ